MHKILFFIPILLLSCVSTQASMEKSDFEVKVSDEIPSGKYSRKEWKHWIDEDRDCQDTRQEVLIAESVVVVTFADARNCTVLSGEWHDPYTGEVFTDPKKLDVDHMVPLAEAWRSGGWKWDAEKKKQFANDLSNPQHLIAVKAGANRQKGDKDPSAWLPPLETYRCKYISDWIRIKQNYSLTADIEESKVLMEMTRLCK